MLRWIWRDWLRAPISGTVALLCLVASFMLLPSDRGLLYLILAAVINNGRGPMPKEGE